MMLLALAAVLALADTTRSTVVYVVRHAEKAALPANDPVLSPAGIERALALDSLIGKSRPVVAVITTPTARTRATAAPVAARHGLTPIEIPVRGGIAAHAREVADSALARQGIVLVVGHSNTVGYIVEALGGPKVGDLPDTEYRSIWTVTLDKEKVAVVRARFGR
jgi:phosphohistidine phosphatase SixA